MTVTLFNGRVRYEAIDPAVVAKWFGRSREAVDRVNRMTDNGDVLLTQTEDGHHKFVDAPVETAEDVVKAMRAPVLAARAKMTRGALVQLNSGGPIMTVEQWTSGGIIHGYVIDAENVEVVWFIDGVAARDTFHYSMLKLAETK